MTAASSGNRAIAGSVDTPPKQRLNSPMTVSQVSGCERMYSSEPTTSRLSVNRCVTTPPFAALLSPWLRTS
jgi:hypothetical protein